MIWFTSDLHFYHNNVIKHCDRPFSSLKEMHKTLIENWNNKVKKREMVWVLGDFSFAGIETTREIVEQLNGDIRIVRGNHDKQAKQLLEMGFTNVYENHQICIEDYTVNLSHFPHYALEKKYDLVDRRYPHKRIYNEGIPLLHGHTHSKERVNTKNGLEIHVGTDAWNYGPVGHKTIIKLIQGNYNGN